MHRAIASLLLTWSLCGSIVWAESAADQKYLIIHADDAGMSHSVNRATIDAMENGVVSSASIMVPCPWFKEFAKYAAAHPELDFGVHLTLNSEWENYRWGPVASADKTPSLVDPEGYLWDNVPQVAKNVKAEEADVELRAQIDRAIQFGVPLSHLDTHMGAVVSRPDLAAVYVQLGLDYDLPVLFLKEMDEKQKREYPLLATGAALYSQQLQRQGLPLLDRLVQFYGGDDFDQRRARYIEALRDVQPGLNQLIIHCGYYDDELRAITNSAARRDADRRIFSDPRVADLIDELGIQIVSWKQAREMQDSGSGSTPAPHQK